VLSLSTYPSDLEETLRKKMPERFGPESRGLLHGRWTLGDESSGISAQRVLSSVGCFALFEWADWPPSLREKFGTRVEEFHRDWPDLRPSAPGSAEWSVILGGAESDPQSSREIGEIFQSRWGRASTKWVVSERDPRGRGRALVHTENLGDIGFEFLWRGIGVWAFGNADHDTLRPVLDDLHEWAGRRIKPILDVLRHKLHELYGDRFRGLYVFGSYARPDAGIELPVDSDLDVALVLSDFTTVHEERERFGDIVYDLSLEHGLAISVVPVREADYREGRTAFTREISSYAVPAR
jgi:predicted nucleotidyltransferase